MPTTVVNLRRDPYDVYIGRARRGQPPTKWGNPFIVGKPAPPELLQYLGDRPEAAWFSDGRPLQRGDAIVLYRALIETKLEKGDLTPEDFRPLRGATLGCFCKPKPCHGDVVADTTNAMFPDD